MSTKLFASDPEWEEINYKQLELCWIMNPNVHFNVKREIEFMPEMELLVYMLDTQLELADMLLAVPPQSFRTFVEGMEIK